MNVVQHYQTFKKTAQPSRGQKRTKVLSNAGFKETVHTIISDVHGSPIQYARELADRISSQFGKNVHLVLLNLTNMDNQTGYRVYQKYLD